MPWRIEDGMKRMGANYVRLACARLCGARQQPGDWAQNFSPAETTAKLVEVLGQ